MEINPRLEKLIKYMAETDPRAVNRLGYKYGFVPAQTDEGREGMLLRGVMEEGDEFVRDMAKMHPDAELIQAAFDGSDAGYPNARQVGDGYTIKLNAMDGSIDNSSGNTVIKAGVAHTDLCRMFLLIVLAVIIAKMF